MNIIPSDASPSVKDGFRSVWRAIDELGKRDINMHGSRIINAGDARQGSEYVTLRQVRNLSEDAATVREIHRITETYFEGPWSKILNIIHPANTGTDQVSIGAATIGSSTPKLYIRGTAGVVASLPSIGAIDWLVIENNGNSAMSFITPATGNASIKWFGSGDTATDGRVIYNRNTRAMTFMTATTDKVSITSAGSVLLAVQGALATTATDGFTYIPTCAGTPTGVPTAQTGMAALVYDTTNHVLYVYDGAWRTH